MQSLLLLSPLLISILLLQLGVGALAPLDALAADYAGFSKFEIGLLGSAHFFGFILGCLIGPSLIGRSGYARAFAASAALGVIATLAHPLYLSPEIWMLCRVAAGFAIAIGYTVVESWFHAKIANRARGRLLSVYRGFDAMGAMGAQLLLIQLAPDVTLAYSYILVAMIAAASLLPLSLTTQPPPEPPKRPRIRLRRAIATSPLAAAGVFAVGLTSASFRMIGPIYATEFALSRAEVAYFLAAGLLGAALAQPIVGWISDLIDRRRVLVGVSVAAVLVCGGLASGLAPADPVSLTIGAALFGAAALPLFSVSVAHANDFCPRDFIVELNASLLLLFALGAVLSPTAAALLIERFGPDALWAFIGAVHLALIGFALYRATRRPSVPRHARQPYRGLPRTSILLGRLLGRKERGADPEAPRQEPAPRPLSTTREES